MIQLYSASNIRKKGYGFDRTPRENPETGYFFSGRAIVSRIDVSAMMFFIL